MLRSHLRTMLTKLWRTIRGLREIERSAPETLRVHAARLKAAKQELARATAEKLATSAAGYATQDQDNASTIEAVKF